MRVDPISRIRNFSYRYISGLVLAILIPFGSADAHGFSVLYNFAGGSDGIKPEAGVIADSAGNLYGTTNKGGSGKEGTVFRLAPDGTEIVLHNFAGTLKGDGGWPLAGLIKDGAGNLYGTTRIGGFVYNAGTVFMVAPDGTLTLLHSFAAGSDGYWPYAGVIRDKEGNLYGTTSYGKAYGTVFKLAPDGTNTVLHNFTGGSDGRLPMAPLLKDTSGNLFGTTAAGGGAGCAYGCGTAFKVAPDGKEKVLYAFTGGSDGGDPLAGLVADSVGNLYGTTEIGGSNDFGAVFKLAPDGVESTLHSFAGGSDGTSPRAGVIRDEVGNLYGTTSRGGTHSRGTVFRVAPDGTETVLHSFNGSDGSRPSAGLSMDKAGNLYGTTTGGGASGHGTIFKLTP